MHEKLTELVNRQHAIANHPLYSKLDNLKAINIFMQHHIFAVWDFMSLLKTLQHKITCIEVPWRPSQYPTSLVRLINQIVVGEESDIDQSGIPKSHFELYLRAMDELGISSCAIRDYLTNLDLNLALPAVRDFVAHNLNLCQNGSVEEVAANFFYGREKLVPTMFAPIVSTLEKAQLKVPTLIYYLKRHIEVDSDEHGPMAMQCLQTLCDTKEKEERAYRAGLEALKMRQELWDKVLILISTQC